jgi:hypothetical protein
MNGEAEAREAKAPDSCSALNRGRDEAASSLLAPFPVVLIYSQMLPSM